MAVRKTSSKNSALKQTPKTPKTPSKTPKLLTQSNRKAIIREVLSEIYKDDMAEPCPKPGDHLYNPDDEFLINNHFAWGSSQVNTDLAMAAQCEAVEFVTDEGDTFYDLYGSTEYQKLMQTFREEAEAEPRVDALTHLVWRAYNAGRLSPERMEPDIPQLWRERICRREQERLERLARAKK